MIHRVNIKSKESIAHEWDDISDLRYQQILAGKDISYDYVLVPEIFRLSKNCDTSSVLDIGCGVGFLTKKLAKICGSIVAIDISEKSLHYARENCKQFHNVIFFKGSVEDFAKQCEQPEYTLAIANMSLITIVNLTKTLKSIHDLIIQGGKLIITLSHPCFWPIYWGYFSEEWFNYSEEIIIEAPFKISSEQSDLKTTHVHRPIEKYYEAIVSCGFELETINEPVPTESIQSKYKKKWKFPRFLAFRCLRK